MERTYQMEVTPEEAADADWIATERLGIGTILSGHHSGFPFNVTSRIINKDDRLVLVITAVQL